MVTRRALLLGSSAAAIGALVGCSADPTPRGGTPAATPGPTGGTPSPAPSSAGASPSTSATPSATPTATAAPAVPRHPTPVLDEVVADRLDVPWGLAFLASGDALVGERGTARIRRVTPGGRAETLGEVAGVVAPEGPGEGGLLGLALAPGAEDTLFAYVTTADDDRVVRLSLAGGRIGRPRVVLAGIPTSTHHHGGRLLFDAGGRLLVSTGTPSSPGWPRPPQRRGSGLRRGRLWATEFGDKEADELNLIRPGRNYGWPEVEGRSDVGRFTSPAASWSPTSSCSPAGVAIAGSTAFVGALQGRCLFGVPLDGAPPADPRPGWPVTTGGCGRWPSRPTGRCG